MGLKCNQENCGGIAGLQCCPGYRCLMPKPIYPDAMGKCMIIEDITQIDPVSSSSSMASE